MSRKLLLVDDEQSIRRVLGISLQERGYDVLTAEDGQQAWEIFSKILLNTSLFYIAMKKNNFREKLAEFLTEDELSGLKTAFDVVGDIAILEIDEEFKNKEKQIANALLDYHKNINTVLKKAG